MTKKRKQQTQRTFPSPPEIFRNLISQIQSSQDLKLPVLKSLYHLLIHFSLNEKRKWSNFEVALNYSDTEFNQYKVLVEFKELCSLSDILFAEVDDRFKLLFYALGDVSASQESNLWASIEELTLLLRCCLIILTLLSSDHYILRVKSQVLLSILSRLISVEFSRENENNYIRFKKLIPSQDDDGHKSHTTPVTESFAASVCLSGPSDPCLTSLCRLLQVFADELWMHKLLRENFMRIDSASSTSEMLFVRHSGLGDIGSVLEVIAAHFILSISSEQAFEGSVSSRLYWEHGKDYRVPEMSLRASLSLLVDPIMVSAPKMFQAHLILLVSEAIGINVSSENMKPDLRIMDCYLNAFEMSIILYTRHMPSLQMDGHPIGSNGSAVKSCMRGSRPVSYDSYLQPATRNKVYHLVTKLNDSWESYKKDVSLRKKSDLVDASITYVKDNVHAFDKSCQDKILSIFTSIARRESSEDICDSVLYKEGRGPQDIYLLASILKLMSSSMLQVIGCLRHRRNSGCAKSLQDVLNCKVYDFVLELVGCFRQCNIHLPIQKFVSDMMDTHPTRHKESKWMFLHFLGLLSLSYASGIDFLVKDCIFTVMSLLSLFVFEEGDLDALSSFFGSGLESISFRSSDNAGEASVERKSSKKIASKFQEIQKSYMRTRSATVLQERNNETGTSENGECSGDIGTDKEPGETCTAEVYLRLRGDDGGITSSELDLTDFIECKQGKDYSVWLKNRERYRKLKWRKDALHQREKRRKSWRSPRRKT